MDEPVPKWKVWHPLSIWAVLGVFLVTNLVFTFIIVALREGLGLPVPMWLAGGLGGGVGWMVTVALAKRRLARDAASKNEG